MPITPADILNPGQMELGDIIIEYESEPEHSLMWVGGTEPKDKPIVHSVESEDANGILRQSSSYFFKGSEASAEVYRCRKQKLASKASEIACQFAVSSLDQRYIHAKQKDFPIKLKTGFSQDRLGLDQEEWGKEAVVRAARAYYRAITKSALSPTVGVTCSQFITYVYQAAGIDLLVAKDRLAKIAITLAGEAGLLGQLNLHGKSEIERSLIIEKHYKALNGIRSRIDLAVPEAMKVNAAVTSVSELTEHLKGSGEFEHVGNLN